MIKKTLRSIFIFNLILVCYKAPNLFVEGYHDRAFPMGEVSSDEIYIVDIISPIYILPYIVAISVALYTWLYNRKNIDFIDSITYIFGSIMLLFILYGCHTLYGMWMSLNGLREYNEFNYIGSIMAIAVGLAPWVYMLLTKSNSNKDDSTTDP